jgi:two-component system CheB/CheR fusion protein
MKVTPPAHPTFPTRPAALTGDFQLSLEGVRVLVVDDEEDVRKMIPMVLEVHGALVTPASTTAEALQLLEDQQFDVIISDLGMEPEDSLMLLREVRARGIQTPAAALSAYTGVQPQQRALEAGFQLHLDKPVETLYLAAAVADLAEMAKNLPPKT